MRALDSQILAVVLTNGDFVLYDLVNQRVQFQNKISDLNLLHAMVELTASPEVASRKDLASQTVFAAVHYQSAAKKAIIELQIHYESNRVFRLDAKL